MKQTIESLLAQALTELKKQGIVPPEMSASLQLERARDPSHGDFATNLALTLAKQSKLNPRDLAQKIVAAIPPDACLAKVDIAGPGFINFTLTPQASYAVVSQILREKENYGQSAMGRGQSIHLEYLSSNPTGPLHVGHGRSAAYGACVAALLKAVGYKVHREYYVNDAGRQMQIVGLSIWLRYLEALGENIALPKNAYQGDYIIEIAEKVD